ncbi:MAG: AAA family ATPase [Acidimicrobiales bacterium]
MTELSPGRVVILNGTSSSGKSTIVSLFIEQRAAAGEWWLPVATDDFNMKLVREWATDGPFGEDGMRFVQEPFGIRVHLGKRGRRLQAAYHRTVAVCAREGFDVIVDEVCLDAEAAADWRGALVGLDVTWVALRCDPDVAEAREHDRGDRAPGLARGLSAVVHRHASYDLELDSTNITAAELVSRLVSHVCDGRSL